MTQELLYTSAPEGLKPGSRGFCTVVSTRGLSAPLASALESLSGYRPVFPLGHPQAARNPVVFSHVTLSAGGQTHHVLSRIADFGVDYSRRGNKLAHHLVVAASECPAAGPAWLLGRPGFMQKTWDGQPRLLPSGRGVPAGDVPAGVCRAWAELTGDGGWAGVVAESFLAAPERPVQLIFSPGMDLLPLFQEVIALLPAELRWDATFTTYFTNLPPGVACTWRGLLKDSAEAKQSRRQVRALRLDLTEPLGPAAGGALVQLARTGGIAPPDPDSSEAGPPMWLEQWPALPSDNGPPPPPIVLESAEAPAPYALAPSLPPRPPSGGPPRPPRDRRRLEALYAEEGRRLSRRWRIALLTVLPTLLLAVLGIGGYFLFRGVSVVGSEIADAAAQVADHADRIEKLAQEPGRSATPPDQTGSAGHQNGKGLGKSEEIPLAAVGDSTPERESESSPVALSNSGEEHKDTRTTADSKVPSSMPERTDPPGEEATKVAQHDGTGAPSNGAGPENGDSQQPSGVKGGQIGAKVPSGHERPIPVPIPDRLKGKEEFANQKEAGTDGRPVYDLPSSGLPEKPNFELLIPSWEPWPFKVSGTTRLDIKQNKGTPLGALIVHKMALETDTHVRIEQYGRGTELRTELQALRWCMLRINDPMDPSATTLYVFGSFPRPLQSIDSTFDTKKPQKSPLVRWEIGRVSGEMGTPVFDVGEMKIRIEGGWEFRFIVQESANLTDGGKVRLTSNELAERLKGILGVEVKDAEAAIEFELSAPDSETGALNVTAQLQVAPLFNKSRTAFDEEVIDGRRSDWRKFTRLNLNYAGLLREDFRNKIRSQFATTIYEKHSGKLNNEEIKGKIQDALKEHLNPLTDAIDRAEAFRAKLEKSTITSARISYVVRPAGEQSGPEAVVEVIRIPASE